MAFKHCLSEPVKEVEIGLHNSLVLRAGSVLHLWHLELAVVWLPVIITVEGWGWGPLSLWENV